MSDLFSVKDKRVVITGGTSGIGLGAAKHLTEQGANVIISGRREEGQQLAEEIGARFVQCDVRDEQQIKSMIEKAADMLGGQIDALFLNAGFSNEPPFIDELEFDRMRYLFQVNFDHVWAGIHYAVPYMAEYGSIAATTSPAANTTTVGFSAYSPAKAATKMLTRTAAIELGARNIRVNSINPGAVITGMQYPGAHDWPIVSQLKAGGEWRQPQEIAMFFHFLTSDASRPMTGAELTCDDGISAGISLNAMTGIAERAFSSGEAPTEITEEMKEKEARKKI